MSNNSTQANSERRRYFRIADSVNLSFTVLGEEDSTKKSYVSSDILGTCSLANALEMITQDSRMLLRRIEYREPEVADYLTILDTKIELVSKALLMLNGGQESKEHNYEVSLSASGLAFDSAELLPNGVFIEIKMVLSSYTAVLVLYGKVVYCRKRTDTLNNALPYLVGVDYINLQEEDRELLIKHIFKRQMQQIRESKEE